MTLNFSLASPKFQDVRDLSRHSDERHVPGESGVTESRIAYYLRGIVPVTRRGGGGENDARRNGIVSFRRVMNRSLYKSTMDTAKSC